MNTKTLNIKAKRKTSMGNPAGWNVFINGIKYFCFTLEKQVAIEYCIEKHKKATKDKSK